jgi:hypothetical protein
LLVPTKNRRIPRALRQPSSFCQVEAARIQIQPLANELGRSQLSEPDTSRFGDSFRRSWSSKMFKSLCLVAVVAGSLSAVTDAFAQAPLFSHRNAFGGQTFSNGSYTMPNSFGGSTLHRPGGGTTFSTPNAFGGYNFSSGGYTSPNVFGGFNHYSSSGIMTTYTPNVFGGFNSSSGGYSTPNVMGGFNYYGR